MDSSVRIFVGLGNPGKEYERTRHNAGFMVVDAFVKEIGLVWKHEPSLRSMIAEGNIDGTKMVFVKPTTYMNASGEAVRLVLDRFHASSESMFVVSDDVDLPLGTLRFRKAGSAGGHNGLKSIITHIGSQTFSRLRIGVNPPPENVSLEVHVLNKFVKEEHGIIDRIIDLAVEKLRDPSLLEERTWTV